MKIPTSNPCTIFYLDTSSCIGGAERSLLDLIERLDHSRFKPVVACPADGPLPQILKERGVEVHSCRFSGLGTPIRFLPEFFALKRFGLESHAVLIHGNSTLSVKHALFLGEILGIPNVVHVRDEMTDSNFFHRTWLRHSGCVVAISDAVRQALTHTVKPDCLKRIYNGIDTTRFHPGVDGSEVRREWQWPENTPVVGMVGRFSFEKGTNIFLEAASRIIHEFPQVRFIIVGDVVFSKNRMFKEKTLEKLHSLGLQDCVRLAGHREDVERLMAGMEILVVPSNREAFGRVAAEGGACGKPVVATSVGGLPEIVLDGETGIIVPPEDPDTMSTAVLRLLGDEQLRRTMGIKARERICRFFDVSKTVKEIEFLYDRLLCNMQSPLAVDPQW